MRTLSKKQKALVAGVAAAALGTSGVAYAYWTTTGSGSGTGTVAATNGTLALTASFPTVGLYPGGAVAVTYKASNAGATDLQVGTVHAVVTTSDVDCLPGDFTIPDVIENQVILAGATNVTLANAGTLTFANTALNQDDCKGATITLTLSS